MALLGGALEWLQSVPGWVALAAIFLLPALEASAFVGIVVPGEAAVVIGGALASQGKVSLAGALAAAILGAVAGDTVGYAVGKRWGKKMIPRLSRRRARRVEKAEAFLRRHPGWAVTLGRFPPGLRTIVPGAAGMSSVPYRSFVLYNVLGAVVWGTTFVLLGYEAGRNWRRVETLVSGGGLLLLAALLLGFWLVHSFRKGALAGLRKAHHRPPPG
jgi:membrane-associated protein